MVLWKNDVMWYWWRRTRQNWWSHAYRKISRKYYWNFIKILENLYCSTSRCCIVFVGNRKSLSIQNGGPKFSKFVYFSNIYQFCFDFKTKYIFVSSMIVWFQKKYFVVCFIVYSRFKKFYFRFKLKCQYL